MRLTGVGDQLVLSLSRDETGIAAGSIREAREELRDEEFPGRVGMERSEARRLLTRIYDARGHACEVGVVSLTRDELRVVRRAIREALGALPDWEYPIRMGAEKYEARDLGAAIVAVLRQAAAD